MRWPVYGAPARWWRKLCEAGNMNKIVSSKNGTNNDQRTSDRTVTSNTVVMSSNIYMNVAWL